jgi:hypothetical protein
MKTNSQARTLIKLRHAAGLVAVLLLLSAECWVMCSVGHRCSQFSNQPPVQVPEIGQLFCGR